MSKSKPDKAYSTEQIRLHRKLGVQLGFICVDLINAGMEKEKALKKVDKVNDLIDQLCGQIEVQQKKEQKKDEDFGAGALERLAWIQGYCHTHACPECHFAIETEEAWYCRIAEATGGMVPEYWELPEEKET